MKSLLFTSILSSFTFSSASNVNEIKDVKNSLSNHHEVFAQLKREAHEKLTVPKSFAGKIHKTTNLKLKELSLSPAELQKLHESNESEDMHLRGLRIKNNFVQYTFYADETCTTPETFFGQLVNTCYNEVSKSSGAERSYVVKVNKKENLLVELEYEGSNCRGIPSKVTNLMGDTPFLGWSTCTLFESDDDGSVLTDHFSVDYVSTYPSLGSDNFVSLTSPEEYCSNTENKNYNSYYITPLEKILSTGCVPSGAYFLQYSTSSCATEGQVYVSIYDNPTCSGSPVYYDSIFDPPCTAEVYDDDDDGADDGDDDDDYVETGVVTTSKCN